MLHTTPPATRGDGRADELAHGCREGSLDRVDLPDPSPSRATGRALQREAGLTLFDYMTLSQMSEAPDRRLRMSELAFLTSGSLTRLSNVVKRFEHRGWVIRYPDPSDGRYTIAELTSSGYDKVVEAAPLHVEAVRLHAIDLLSPADQRALVRIAARLRVRPEDVRT
jgi:DNA-binding MarR family transcriptional regulator